MEHGDIVYGMLAVEDAVALFVLLFYPLVFSFIKPKEKADSIKYKLKKLAGIC